MPKLYCEAVDYCFKKHFNTGAGIFEIFCFEKGMVSCIRHPSESRRVFSRVSSDSNYKNGKFSFFFYQGTKILSIYSLKKNLDFIFLLFLINIFLKQTFFLLLICCFGWYNDRIKVVRNLQAVIYKLNVVNKQVT